MMLLAFVIFTKFQVLPPQCSGLLLSSVAFARPTQLQPIPPVRSYHLASARSGPCTQVLIGKWSGLSRALDPDPPTHRLKIADPTAEILLALD